MLSSTSPADHGTDRHSTLEAVPSPMYPGSDGLQHVNDRKPLNGYGDGDGGIEPVYPGGPHPPHMEKQVARSGPGRRTLWIILGVAAVLIVGAIIGGAVGGTRKKSSSGTSGTPTSASTSTPAPTASSALPYPTYAAGLSPDPYLAAVAWPYGDNNLTFRVYYQDQDNFVKESAWDEKSNAWNKPTRLFTAKPRSPLAAIVDPADNFTVKDTRVSLFYLDSSNVLQGKVWTSPKGWTNSTIVLEKYVTGSTSSIAAVSDICAVCTNKTIVMFQDAAGSLQVANGTVDENGSWQKYKADADPLNATSLSASQDRGVFDKGLSVAQQSFWYQRSDETLVANDWNAQQNRWIRESVSLDKIPAHARLGTFAFGGLVNGESQYREVVSSSREGVSINAWSGQANNGRGLWKDSLRPTSLKQADAGSAVAATSWGSAFLTKGGFLTQWSIGSNDTDWLLVGGVPTS